MKSLKLEYKVLLIIFVLLGIGVLIAGSISIRTEKSDVFSVAKDRLVIMSRLISKSLERSMIEADAEFTKDLISDLKTVSGFELRVYNHEGREAFAYGAQPVEDRALQTVLASGKELVVEADEALVSYMPLNNLPTCNNCHSPERKVIGAVQMSVSLQKEYARIDSFMMLMVTGSLLGVCAVGAIMWLLIRHFIITPLKKLESAAHKMAEGDLNFATGLSGTDEIGLLDRAIKDSLLSLSSILRRVQDITIGISSTTEMVGKESDKVVESTMVEAESVSEISSSVEELNAAIAEIAESTDQLSATVQDTVTSIEEMSTTIVAITKISHEVSEGVDTTTSSIHQFSATIKEVVDHAGDLARVSDETLSAVEEITTSVKEVEVSAKEAALLSQKVTEDASTLGITAINKTMEGMEKISASVTKTAKVIERLGGRSEEIGSILTVIDDITDQTTLLALNAAILAAQAGEHGRGFSVVANEIKDLAERTALSTQEIDKLIKTVRQEVLDAVQNMQEGMLAVKVGTELSKDAAGALNKILQSSRKASEMSSSIERTTTEQAKTSRYVTEAIERVRYMVEQIVKATSEQSKGVQQIMVAAERIRDASHQAEKAMQQQSAGSRQISKAVDNVSEMSKHISKAINEQKSGARQIWDSVERIKHIPKENRELASRINQSLRVLSRDSDLSKTEMERFTLYEERDLGILGFGVVPFESPATLYKKFMPLTAHLTRKTGLRFDLRVAQDYKAAIRDLAEGQTKACFMTSITYLEAARVAGARAVAKTLRDGKAYHRAAIVAREDGSIKSLRDIAGKHFAFVDKMSASGYFIPRAMLLDEGIPLERLAGHSFLGYHEEVVNAVLKGEVEAGGVMEAAALRHKEEGLRIIKYSAEYPEFVLCTSDKMTPEESAKLEAALLGLRPDNPETAEVLGAINPSHNGLVRAQDSDFDGVRDILSRVGEV